MKHQSLILASSFLCLVAPPVVADVTTKVPRPIPQPSDVKTAPLPPSPSAWHGPASDAPREAPVRPVHPDVAQAQAIAKAIASPRKGDPIDHSHVYWDEPGDGAVWARGRNWKASFDAQGVSYIPFFGSAAPHDFPVRLELRSVERGGAPIELVKRGVAQSGDVVSIDRGALREIWRASPDTAEQTFVIPELAGAGDLALHIAYSSELEATESTDPGFRFANALGSVSYGSATVIDARGHSLALESHLAAGEIEIDVPSSFLADAVFPITIDPILGTSAVDTTAAITVYPDVATDGVNIHNMIVYTVVFSSSDLDLYSISVDALSGAPLTGTGVYLDYTTDSWNDPRVAFNALNQTFLAAAHVYPGGGTTNPIIRCRARSATSTTMYAQQTVNGAEIGDKFGVGVGGDPILVGPTFFMVVWTRVYSTSDYDIHARLVAFDGTPQGAVIYVDNTTADDFLPRISKTDGREPVASQSWNITWTRIAATDDIYGAQYSWDGIVVTPTFAITSGVGAEYSATSSLLDATAFGSTRPYAVTFQAGQTPNHDLYFGILEGTQLQGQVINLNQVDGSDLTQDQINADVDCDGARFAVVYAESFQHSATDFDGYADSLLFGGGQIQLIEGRQNFEFTTASTYLPHISGTFSPNHGPYFGYFGLAWDRRYTPSSDGDVFAGTYAMPQTGDYFCGGNGTWGNCPCSNNTGAVNFGCPNSFNNSGADLRPTGSYPFTSADGFQLTMEGMPPTATCLLFQGTQPTAPGTVFGDGLRCVAGSTIRLGIKTAVGGSASYPEAGDVSISVRGQIPASGGVRYYQCWYRNADPSFCTPAVFNLTNGWYQTWLP